MVFNKVFCFPPSLDLLQEFINSSGIPTEVTVFKVSIPLLVILLLRFLVNVLLFCYSCLSIRLLRVPVLIRAFDQTPYNNIKLFLDVFINISGCWEVHLRSKHITSFKLVLFTWVFLLVSEESELLLYFYEEFEQIWYEVIFLSTWSTLQI